MMHSNLRRWLTHLLLSLVCSAICHANDEAVEIGDRWELLIDEHLIERFQGDAELRMHHPVRREIAVVHDGPTEGNGGNYHTVFEDNGIFRMYFHAWQIPVNEHPAHPPYISYLHSVDGIHWVKPNLGLVELEGSTDNNIVMATINGAECHDLSVFKDDNPAASADARYKAIGLGRNPSGLYAFNSSDAIHWAILNDGQPVMTGHPFDTQNIAFWDPTIQKYRAYIRDFDNGRRDIMTATSEDMMHWTERQWLKYPGAPREQLYTNQIKPYYRAPHILVGFPSRYVDRGWTDATRRLPSLKLREQRSKVSDRYGTAVTDALLMSSRDGVTFHRWPEAFLRPGLRTRHNWAYGDNYIAWHVVETDSTTDDAPRELSLYATESYFTGKMSRLRRYTLRIDGFASAFAPLEGGELLTKPLVFDGDKLLINFSTSAGGSIGVELRDIHGEPLEGFALADCEPIFGDSLEYAVRWRGEQDLSDLAGKPVKLRLVLRDADLFAFGFRSPGEWPGN